MDLGSFLQSLTPADLALVLILLGAFVLGFMQGSTRGVLVLLDWLFAFVIAMVGCFEGLRVTGSAESVGRLTTKSVVESIFLVIVLDALFSILFSILGV